MIGLCRGEPPLGLLRSFAASSHRQRSPASEPWNKCDNFYENERIITIHSVFCRVLLSIFSGRAQFENEHINRTKGIFKGNLKAFVIFFVF